MYAFPVAIAFSLFSTTAFLIVLAVLGRAELSAEVGVVQGASLGVFLAFSANARNLILGASNASRFVELVRVRLILLPVLCFGVWFLSTWVVPVAQWLIGCLVLRRALEWLGELSLSEAERSRNLRTARRFVVGQLASFGLLAAAVLGGEPWLKSALFVWSLSPLIGSTAWIRQALRPETWTDRPAGALRTAQLAAHLTSSWAIGLSTYLFRLFLILLAGKALAGSLVAGFALGGMLNSLYTYAVGPSLASGSLSIKGLSGRLVRAVILALLVGGLMTAALPGFPLRVQAAAGTNWPVFIQTIGFSIVGGLVMIWAQSIRLKILHATKGDDVMVPDVLANVLILASVPFAHYLLGPGALPLLFLWNAVLTATIYLFVLADEAQRPAALWHRASRDRLQAWLAFTLCVPWFFQLSGHVFRSTDMIFDSQASILMVPLPLSAVSCFLGLAILLRVRAARSSAAFLFAFFVAMLPNVLLVTAADSIEQLSKMILLIQFILPVFALVLGQSYVMPARAWLRYEVVMFSVAVAVMAAELVATWMQGSKLLVPYLYFFSIYQHLQYVPTLMLVLFGLGLPTMLHHDRWRPWAVASLPLCVLYAASSASMLVLALATACMAGGAWLLWVDSHRRFAVLWTTLFAVSMLGYFQIVGGAAFTQLDSTLRSLPMETARPAYWDGIAKNLKSLILGHVVRPDRQSAPSAHNYYLDLVYNFGAVALLPWLFVLYRTAKAAWSAIRSRLVAIDLYWLMGAVAFFAFVDNSLNVGFRQPYPGILVFFLWGVLMTRLSPYVAPTRP